MHDFKIQAHYYGEDRKRFFFGEKEPVGYHCFSINDDLPGEYFAASSVLRRNIKNRNPLDPVIYCWLLVSTDLAQKFNLNFEKDKKYLFLIKLGEPKMAKFIPTKVEKGYEYEEHQLVLKSKQYFQNTVQKIGFWGSENYFYEVDKKQKNPSRKQNNNNQSQSENRNFWVRAAWICLPILFFFFCLFLFDFYI